MMINNTNVLRRIHEEQKSVVEQKGNNTSSLNFDY